MSQNREVIDLTQSSSPSSAMYPSEADEDRIRGNTVTQYILSSIKNSVTGFEALANYACGGNILVTGERNIDNFGDPRSPITCEPITVRWDSPQGAQSAQVGDEDDPSGIYNASPPPSHGAPTSTAPLRVNRIQFPPPEGTQEQHFSALEDLVRDCSPATFGRHGKDILDESYRKAGKLDNTQFAVNFTPYDYGIISAIAQTLLPGFAVQSFPGKNKSLDHVGVVAELYKLNVYSAPSGMFKAHVDTPRGMTQFGSLVVCLPSPHQGGGLRVSHKGLQNIYDWSNEDAKHLSWCAFYSDVEHEVQPVISGHRITLTYNLYLCEQVGGVLNSPYPSVDPTYYPFYDHMKQALENKDFMPKGGMLGFHCHHRYAHTTEGIEQRMPFALKGLDVAIYTIFGDLGIKVSVAPFTELDDESFRDPYEDGDLECPDPNDEDEVQNAEDNTQDLLDKHMLPRFGKFVSLFATHENVEDGEKPEVLQRCWPHVQHEVSWLNDRQHMPESNIEYLAYGNEAGLGWFYTSVAILIEIPNFSNRAPIDIKANRNMPTMNVEKNWVADLIDEKEHVKRMERQRALDGDLNRSGFPMGRNARGGWLY